jgi:hypothetical protein
VDAFEKEYLKLKGKTVKRVVNDGGAGHDRCYGLQFADGTIAWIMSDPEGNGPGFLSLQAPQDHVKEEWSGTPPPA